MVGKKTVFIVGVVGPTGSGKSMFAKMLADRFGGRVISISSDMYYKDQSDLPLEKRLKSNMDNPDAIDTDLLVEHLKQLAGGRPIEQPVYDFATHTREKSTFMIHPRSVIIVEGLLILVTKKLRRFFDLKLYIDVDADLRLARRIMRDVQEKRSNSLEAAIEQYMFSARPMYKLYVEPQKDLADLIVPWNKKEQESVDTISARIHEMLHSKSTGKLG